MPSPLAGTIPFRVPIEICAARSCKVNSKGTGVAVVFVKTRQTCPSVSTSRRYYSRYRGASGSTADKENAQLDSWTVGGSLRRPCPLSLNRPCSGDERKRRRIDSYFRRHVEFPRCRWDVSIELRGFVFGSSEWPIATRNVPPDFL